MFGRLFRKASEPAPARPAAAETAPAAASLAAAQATGTDAAAMHPVWRKSRDEVMAVLQLNIRRSSEEETHVAAASQAKGHQHHHHKGHKLLTAALTVDESTGRVLLTLAACEHKGTGATLSGLLGRLGRAVSSGAAAVQGAREQAKKVAPQAAPTPKVLTASLAADAAGHISVTITPLPDTGIGSKIHSLIPSVSGKGAGEAAPGAAGAGKPVAPAAAGGGNLLSVSLAVSEEGRIAFAVNPVHKRTAADRLRSLVPHKTPTKVVGAQRSSSGGAVPATDAGAGGDAGQAGTLGWAKKLWRGNSAAAAVGEA